MVLLGALLITLGRSLGRRAVARPPRPGGMAFTGYAAHFEVLKPYSFVHRATLLAP
ncbi:hypothetical protein ATK30_7052 [Amycolatopsis echigonensis]|uniref:Uncharacterized protein n=1 Tax=Amycolatopsis echigonensis TaxID=2576905 RepID=A0A2N3WQF3_9PSEU|nr:hypothetical protein [Amycolatopsis niigatensis]PKV96116.1 hypothetical protein ATK30_7052 [Amycolatopsis niigatensis]